MSNYPIPTKNVDAAMRAHSNLNIFGAIESLLTSGALSGCESQATKRIVVICQKEMQRQLKLIDRAVENINKGQP